MYVHESERVGKYESPSVGLAVKVFRPRCGLGQQGLCADGWTSRSSRCQLSVLPQTGRAKPGAALQRRSSPPGLRSLCLFHSLSGGAQRRALELSAPSPSTQPPFECADWSDTRSPGNRPSSSHLRPGTPPPPRLRLLHSACPAGPQLQPVRALVCAAGLNPKDSRAEPSKEEAGRRIQNPCT